MNVKYHVACGVALDLYFGTPGTLTLFSVLPDTPLIANEYRLWKDKRPFKEWEVPCNLVHAYFLTHSVFALMFVLGLDWKWGLAYFVHLFADLFTHTGRFASKPFYPISRWQFPWGRNILK